MEGRRAQVTIGTVGARLALLLIVALLPLAAAQQLTVFAASSLTEAFEDIAAAFEEANPGTEVLFGFAGSSTLATQILQGAPADVFASADRVQMRAVEEGGVLAGPVRDFASNRLVVIVAEGAGVATVADLARPGVLLVLAAPEVPVGAYGREVLTRLETTHGPGFAAQVLANLVSEEPNVRQVASKVLLGEADAAIVYATDARVLSGVRVIEFPAEAGVEASYPIAVLRDAPQPELARAFVAFVLSPAGQALLAARGFTAAP